MLHLSEHAAYGRIEAARAARRFPIVLEFHHVKPVADGGQARPENIELRCRAHNKYEADQYFWAEAQA